MADLTGQRIQASDGQHYDVLRVHTDYGIQVQRVGGRKEWVPSLGQYTVVGETAALAKAEHAEAQAAAPPTSAPAPAGATMSPELLQRIEMNTDRTVELLEELVELLKAMSASRFTTRKDDLPREDDRSRAVRLPVQADGSIGVEKRPYQSLEHGEDELLS